MHCTIILLLLVLCEWMDRLQVERCYERHVRFTTVKHGMGVNESMHISLCMLLPRTRQDR
jgi:hypothetical protein